MNPWQLEIWKDAVQSASLDHNACDSSAPHRVGEGLGLHAGGQEQGELLAELGGWVTALVVNPAPHNKRLFST